MYLWKPREPDAPKPLNEISWKEFRGIYDPLARGVGGHQGRYGGGKNQRVDRYSKKNDSREELKTAFLTLLPNEGAPASNDGKGRQGGERIFRGGSLPRAVCLPGGFVAARNTPAKNTHPRAAKIRSQPFQVFFWRKRQAHTRSVVQRAGKRLFSICFLTMLMHISNWNTKK